jgi:hypothetical protein
MVLTQKNGKIKIVQVVLDLPAKGVRESKSNPPGIVINYPYFFLFDLFLEARAEILGKISLVFFRI